MSCKPEINELRSLSARVGQNPLLVQASSGNTSIKLDGTLWIKASGKWLAHAQEEDIFIPIDLAVLRLNLDSVAKFSRTGAWVNGNYLQASIETAMHGVLPNRVVVHVHSVNAISWAVRLDGPERLAKLFEGLRWSWIPYVSSGLPLARMIAKAVHVQPGTVVFVLANHGLVICGESCDAAEELLGEVERRLAVIARAKPDAVGERVLRGGILYPCEAIFLGAEIVSVPLDQILSDAKLTFTQRAVLNGLLEVLRRVEAAAPIRYLSGAEISTLLNEDAHRYQLCAEKNAVLNNLTARVPAHR